MRACLGERDVNSAGDYTDEVIFAPQCCARRQRPRWPWRKMKSTMAADSVPNRRLR